MITVHLDGGESEEIERLLVDLGEKKWNIFLEYMHPDLKLRMALYNYYLKRFKNIKNKEEVARYCSKYDIDKNYGCEREG